VLDGSDRDAVLRKGRRVIEVGRCLQTRGDGSIRMIGSEKDQSVACRRGPEVDADRMPGMQADTLDGYRRA
jgi:hypothetical protein